MKYSDRVIEFELFQYSIRIKITRHFYIKGIPKFVLYYKNHAIKINLKTFSNERSMEHVAYVLHMYCVYESLDPWLMEKI